MGARQLGRPASRKKLALAEHLINGLFPEEADAKNKFMIASLMTRKQLTMEEAPQLLLKLVAALDVREAEQFNRIKMRAADDLALKAMKEKRARASKQNQHEDNEQAEHSGEDPREPGQAHAKRKRDSEAARGSAEAAAEPGPARPHVAGARAAADAEAQQRVKAQRVKAPPELLDFLPAVNKLYLRWQPTQRRVMAEFPPEDRNAVVNW